MTKVKDILHLYDYNWKIIYRVKIWKCYFRGFICRQFQTLLSARKGIINNNVWENPTLKTADLFIKKKNFEKNGLSKTLRRINLFFLLWWFLISTRCCAIGKPYWMSDCRFLFGLGFSKWICYRLNSTY